MADYALVPDKLWTRAYIAERLDIQGAIAWCRNVMPEEPRLKE